MNVRVGDVVLVEMLSAVTGPAKLRPAVVLGTLPGAFQRLLIAGISTSGFGLVPDWDDWFAPSQPRYVATGLKRASAVRLSYLEGIAVERVKARIGYCPDADITAYRIRIGALLARPLHDPARLR